MITGKEDKIITTEELAGEAVDPRRFLPKRIDLQFKIYPNRIKKLLQSLRTKTDEDSNKNNLQPIPLPQKLK